MKTAVTVAAVAMLAVMALYVVGGFAMLIIDTATTISSTINPEGK